MIAFIVRRLLTGLVLLAAITTFGFTLLYLGGGDIARKILGENADDQTVAQKAARAGLDRPVFVQYGDWVSNALTGNLGASWFSGQPVAAAILSRLSVTLSLVTGAVVVIAVVSVVLGVLAATKRGWVDRLAQVIALLGFAIPGFLFAVGLVLLFALTLGWFDPTGYVAFTTSPSGWAKTVTLPVIALALGGIAAVPSRSAAPSSMHSATTTSAPCAAAASRSGESSSSTSSATLPARRWPSSPCTSSA